MLKVLPVQSKLKQEEICLKCGVKYNPDALAYSATVDDRIAGICQFKITAEGGIIYDLAPADDFDDFESMFIMGRGTLNFIDLCGVHKAYFVGETKDETLIRAVGFKKNEEGKFEINLEGFFTDHCHNHKEK
ncbi:MAG: hypothetical protein IJ038_01020 [Clostridia bacterium]|nr:hypothetical protein [Clostridia bacterium]